MARIGGADDDNDDDDDDDDDDGGVAAITIARTEAGNASVDSGNLRKHRHPFASPQCAQLSSLLDRSNAAVAASRCKAAVSIPDPRSTSVT